MTGSDQNIADIRREYASQRLTRRSVSPDPFAQFAKWMDETLDSSVIDATAMTISTVDESSSPSSRIVLLKGYGPDGFVFYTNYDSSKAHDLSTNPAISLHFYWAELDRQIRIQGTAQKTSRAESDAYFATRPRASRIGTWASHQSQELSSRDELDKRIEELTRQFDGAEVICPPFWGGYRVTPVSFEFWQGGSGRLHDRILYTLDDGAWLISRLAP